MNQLKVRTVLVLDDQVMFREMLVDNLSSAEDIEVVASLSRFADANAILNDAVPDVILTDTEVGGEQAIPWMKAVKKSYPNTCVIFLSNQRNEHVLMSAIAGGADGYIHKNNHVTTVAGIVRIIANGQSMYDPSLTAGILKRISRQYSSRYGLEFDASANLSARERDVVSLVVQGRSNHEIAQAMFISENTVKTHMRRIFQRLGISSRRQLVQLFQED